MKRVRRLSLMVTASIGVVMLMVLVGASRGTEGTPVRHEAPTAYGQTSTLLADGRWVFIGGVQGHDPQASAVLWDPVSHTLTPTWHVPQFARAGHTATVLPDGTVLVLGGIGESGEIVATAELFTPATQTFTPIETPGLTPRAFHSATLLTDGHVLIAGGRTTTDEVLATADVWDPRTLAGEGVPGALQHAREEHGATLLPDGSVWLSGGREADGRLVRDNERYTPTSQAFTLSESPQIALAPAVVMQSLPPAGTTEVPLDGIIALRLSQPAPVTTVSPATVRLTQAAGAVATTVTAAEGGRLVFVTPIVPLAPATTYTLTVNGVTDVAGAPLPFTAFSFTTTGTPAALQPQDPPAPRPAPAGTQVKDAQGVRPSDTTQAGPSAQETAGSAAPRAVTQGPPLHAPPGVTALTGRVLRLNGRPLARVTLELDGHHAQTDNQGRFLLTDLPMGQQELLIDGRSANHGRTTYGVFEVGVEVAAGTINTLPYTIWMPELDLAHAVTITSPTTSEVVVTNPRLPGLEFHLPPGVIVKDHDGNVVTQLSLTPVPLDKPPHPLPVNVDVPLYFTLQPGGAYIVGAEDDKSKGGWIVYPNVEREAPGAKFNFWQYDPEGIGWHVYGLGTVTADGTQIVPDAGVRIYEFTGAMINGGGAPPSPGPPPDGGPGVPPGGGPTPGGPGPNPSPGPSPGPGPGPNPGPGPSPGPGPDPDPPPRSTEDPDPSPEPNPEPAPGDPGGGDPVSLNTGLVILHKTDVVLPDIIPIILTRVYRTNDSNTRPFGIGTTHPYEMFLWSANQYQEVDLILPDGGRVHYVRTSPGTTATSAVFEHTASQTAFYKSKITWNGRGWDLTLTDGTVYVFGENAPLQSIRDRYGNLLALTRASTNDYGSQTGNILQLTTSNGRWLAFTYDAQNRITQARDNSGRTWIYTYDASGRLWKVTDPNSGVQEYTYDASHRMLTRKNPRGNVLLTNQYDANGRVVQQTLVDGGVYQFAYTTDASGKITQTDVTDPRGYVRRVTFDSTGHTLSDMRALGTPEQQTTTFTYQAGTNLLTSMTDALGRQSTFTYDALGNLTSRTRLAGTPQAVTTTWAYDPTLQRVTSVTNSLGNTATLTYDSLGNVLTATNPLSQQSTFTYNAAGQVVSATDPLGNTTQLAYVFGALTTITDPLGNVVMRTVDNLGRPRTVTTPLGQQVQYSYDALNRLTQLTNPLGHVTSFTYDASNNLLTLTDAKSQVTTYTYNTFNRVATRQDPLLRTESYQYTLMGHVSQSTDRKSQVTSLTYDGLNRLTQVTYAGGATKTYTYDAGNRLTQVVDSVGGTVSWMYDGFGRVLSETTAQGTVSYTYDAGGRRASMTVPGQAVVNYTYDNANRLTQISKGTATTTVTYDAAGRRTSLTLPNGVQVAYSYDTASRLTGLTYTQGATTLGNLTYSYDKAGRRVATGGTFARTGVPSAISTANYSANNQQLALGTTSATYDNNGNLATLTDTGGTTTYTWNSRDQLTNISGPSLVASFTYDAVGRRTSKTINGTTTTFFYDGRNVVQELNGATPVATLLNGPGVDAILSRTEATGTTSFLPDGLGSTIALTDSAGTLQTQYTYEPFGKTTATGAASTNAFTYTGREDDGTGLYYYRTRYYHPALQRFVSEDPIGFDGGDTNLYAYVGNDPVNFIDPHGLINDNPNNWGFEGGGGSIPPASAPTGRSGNPLVPPNPNAPARNAPGSINGRPYVGHAFDQMQNRGIPPSVVEDAISTGQQYPGRYGRTQYYDPKNDITVITEPDGTVVTVRPGGPSGLYK